MLRVALTDCTRWRDFKGLSKSLVDGKEGTRVIKIERDSESIGVWLVECSIGEKMFSQNWLGTLLVPEEIMLSD